MNNDNTHTTINVSTITILKVLMILLLMWLLFAIRDILILLVVSVMISSAIDPLADYLQKKRIPRALSVLLVYAIFLGMIGLVIYLLVPPISQQFMQISQSNFYETFTDRVGIFRQNLNHFGVGQTIENSIKNFAGTLGGTLFNTTKGVVTGLVSILTVLVISFYLTAEENGMKNFIKHLTPYKNQPYVMTLVTKIQKKMGAWVLGQLILSIIIFGVTYVGLTVLKVEFALVLALIAGVLEVVPYIGPFIALIPAIFFAFLQNPALALAVVILYTIIQQLENHIIVPVVMSKSVGLNPVIVIMAVLIGGSLGGILGAVIAIPLVSGISVFVNDMMEEQKA